MTRAPTREKETVARCYACGQRLPSPMPARCPLCGVAFKTEPVANELDSTPFAKAFENEEGGWFKMAEWIWYGHAGRATHVGLMPASPASRRFFWIAMIGLGLALGLVAASNAGWHISPVDAPPDGQAWFVVARASGGETALRWNPGQFMVGFGIGFLAFLLIGMLVYQSARRGTRLAHATPFREKAKLEAALDYGFAWSVVPAVGALVYAARVFALFGEIKNWSWSPSRNAFILPAGTLAVVGLVLWWYFLIRACQAAPAPTRGRVLAFVLVGLPVLTLAGLAAWWFGLDLLMPYAFRGIGLA